MHRLLFVALVQLVAILAMPHSEAAEPDREPKAGPIKVSPSDWPWWRGPTRNGVAPSGPQPPQHWSATENILWRTPVPGRGHGSPTVVGDRVFLAAAELDRQVQSVLCFDRQTGKQLWQTEVHQGGFATKGNKKASLASSTVASDGSRLFINFLHDGGVYTTALDLEGHRLWQTRITDYIVHQGYGSSPAVYQDLVIVTADTKAGGAIAALNRATGRVVWKHDRPKLPNYASPIVLTAGGREQLVVTGCDLVVSYDPRTGKKLWEVPGATTETVTSTITDGRLLITSGGYPKNHVAAMHADGSGRVAWEINTRVYVPSLILHGDHLYGVMDSGMAVCLEFATGKEVWRGRLGGTFSSSPVLVGELIYVTNEAGRTFLFKATPEGFEQVAENRLGDDVFATPAICGGRIYMRVAMDENGGRQEYLYCIGKKE